MPAPREECWPAKITLRPDGLMKWRAAPRGISGKHVRPATVALRILRCLSTRQRMLLAESSLAPILGDRWGRGEIGAMLPAGRREPFGFLPRLGGWPALTVRHLLRHAVAA